MNHPALKMMPRAEADLRAWISYLLGMLTGILIGLAIGFFFLHKP